MKPRYYKVVYGFDAMDFVSIEEGPDLERVIFAMSEHIPVSVGGKLIHGKHIIRIEPHVHRYTGWYESYSPTTGDDFAQIARDCPEFGNVLQAYQDRVRDLVQQNKQHLIGRGEPLTEREQLREGSEFAKKMLENKQKKDTQPE